MYIKYYVAQEAKQKDMLTRKQQKNRSKQQEHEEDQKKQELLQKPKEYVVKFTFPSPPPLAPPVLGLHGKLRKLQLLKCTHLDQNFFQLVAVI